MILKAKFVDVDSEESLVIMHDDDCAELGIVAHDRVKVTRADRTITAIVQTSDTFLEPGTVGILGKTFQDLCSCNDEDVTIRYTSKPESVAFIRKKMDGGELTTDEIQKLVVDISEKNLSTIEMSAYVTSLYIHGMNIRETADLTVAMVRTGEVLDFGQTPVFDFHSVGGVPGNKITPIVVPIIAAAGLLIPKTSSRAISSAGGTADIVETFCNVSLDAFKLKEVAEHVGGTLAWGGAMNLAPADDLIIKVEYPLGIDPHAQLLASVMSKKKAIGADYLVMDIPMGAGTKVPTMDMAKHYARDFMDLGERLDIRVECAITYGDQPVGRAIGPALEAREAISILEGARSPHSVIEKACGIAGMLLEMGGMPNGIETANDLLRSGAALTKFREIVAAQGGNPDLKEEDLSVGQFKKDVLAIRSGYVDSIRNKELVTICRTAGAPRDKGAGLIIYSKKGSQVDRGDPLFTVYADNQAKLDRAIARAIKLEPVVIEGMIIDRVPSFSRVR